MKFLSILCISYLFDFGLQEKILSSIQLEGPVNLSNFHQNDIWIIDRLVTSSKNHDFTLFLYSNISECLLITVFGADPYFYMTILYKSVDEQMLRVTGKMIKNFTVTNVYGSPSNKYVKWYCSAPMSSDLFIPYTDYKNYLILTKRHNFLDYSVWCLKNTKMNESDENLTKKYKQILEAMRVKYLWSTSKYTKVDTSHCKNVIKQGDEIDENMARLCEESKLQKKNSKSFQSFHPLLKLVLLAPIMWIVLYVSWIVIDKRRVKVAPNRSS